MDKGLPFFGKFKETKHKAKENQDKAENKLKHTFPNTAIADLFSRIPLIILLGSLI